MKAPIALVLCFAVGSSFGYYLQREAPYNVGPNDPYSVEVNSNFLGQPSQRLFWGNNGAGSNQVGGTGLWATITNKFPFLGNMFGRMELPNQYGVPNQYNGVPLQYSGVPSQSYGPPSYQFYQAPPQQYYPQQYFRQFQSGRDVGLTDDAVIITPPQVPINPQPVFPPAPAPAPAPAPVPNPRPEPQPGYQYNKPQYRLELPHK